MTHRIDKLRERAEAAEAEARSARVALRDLIDAIPEATLEADPPLGAWVQIAEAALGTAKASQADPVEQSAGTPAPNTTPKDKPMNPEARVRHGRHEDVTGPDRLCQPAQRGLTRRSFCFPFGAGVAVPLNISKALNNREQKMLDLLRDALWEIESELDANSPEEVKSNPMLQAKRAFVNRARKQIDKWLED